MHHSPWPQRAMMVVALAVELLRLPRGAVGGKATRTAARAAAEIGRTGQVETAGTPLGCMARAREVQLVARSSNGAGNKRWFTRHSRLQSQRHQW
eukprot:COSAG02_NODE_29806_length_562_cov_1.220302_2_plen_94_part_01